MRHFIACVILGVAAYGIAYVAYATSVPKEVTFSTEEDEGSILDSTEGQRQVRHEKFKEAREKRILAEKKAEEERILAEKKAEEERIQAEKKAEEERVQAEKKAEEKRALAKSKAKEKSVTNSTSSRAANNSSGSSLGTFEATAYGPDCVGCSGITANGTDIRNGNIYVDGCRVIAADPRVIPMNSIVKITYSSGKTEMAIVADTGGAIKGKIIDIAFASEAETPAFGRQQVQLELIK